jgi:hypothetical protein
VSIKVRYKNADLGKEKQEVINHFVEFLYDKMPVDNIKEIMFVGDREGSMTTGSYTIETGIIKVLSKNRMLIDVLRTLSHEWIHAAQHDFLGWDKGPDIGGRNEDGCNIYSGMLLKQYQQEHPDRTEIYEMKNISLIESLKSAVIVETWTVKKTNDLIKPNEKLSKSDMDKGLYRRMIERVLNNNLDKLGDYGIENVRGHYFFKGTEKGHPLSYLNTHYGVATYLMNLLGVPKNATKEEAVNIIESGLEDKFEDLLLNPDGEENKLIMSLLSATRVTGDDNEIKAKEYLERQYGNKIRSITIVAETGGELDKSGVDIVMTTTDGETINYQVKPFKFYRIAPDGNAIIYGVSGRTPVNSKQNRWIYVTGNKVLEVDAKNLAPGQYQRDVMFLPSSDIISKSDNLQPWVPKSEK